MSDGPGAWQALPDGAGTTLAIAGDVAVAAHVGALTVWSRDELVMRVDAELPNPARPEIVGDRVFWGPHVIDIAGRSHRTIRAGEWLIPGYAQTAHAWSPFGTESVVAGRRLAPIGSSDDPMAVVHVLDAEGNLGVRLWQADDVPPGALWFGESAIVVGHRDSAVFDRTGRALRTLPGVTSPLRVDGGGDRLLVVESARLAVWELSSGALVGEAKGLWMDAALADDGRQLVSAAFSGMVSVHRVGEGLPVVAELPADASATGVAAGGDQVIASFADLPAVRKATLPIRHDG